MKRLDYICCQGSANRFVMVDCVAQPRLLEENTPRQLVNLLCGVTGLRCDGLLLVVRTAGGGYAMRMFNTDGSEAGMCGNGIRCVARLVHERYIASGHFVLESGGRSYPVRRVAPIGDGLPTYSVEIGVRLTGDDFRCGGDRFVEQPLEELDPGARFTYLHLGNPHLVARVDAVDDERLGQWGERIKHIPARFPQGANVSMVRIDGRQRIFVRTYERGVGFTESCGTAMTASATAMWLTGAVDAEVPVTVENRGGKVLCCVRPPHEGRGLATELVGNATWEQSGRMCWEEAWDDGSVVRVDHTCTDTHAAEREAYRRFAEAVRLGRM